MARSHPAAGAGTPARLAAATAMLAAALPLSGQPGRPGGVAFLPPQTEISFRLEARLDTATLEADLEAGGRLWMRRKDRPGGPVTLSLVQPLEHPWKLYAVDPVGPAGDEVKLAAVVTLPEGTWEALEAAREEVRRFGEEKHRRWAARTGSERPLDGTFAFVVIGPPRGRFTAEIGADGRLRSVTNHLTDRWLPQDFDRLAKDWQAAEKAGGRPPEGYWFWNQGEAEPPPWEPHTYHALAAALELLELPLFPGDDPEAAARRGEGGTYTLELPGVAEKIRRVLETLAPKSRGRLAGSGAATARFTVEEATPERLVVAAEVAGAQVGEGRQAATVTLHRRLAYDRRRRQVETDQLQATLESPGGRLSVEVGHQPYGRQPRSIP